MSSGSRSPASWPGTRPDKEAYTLDLRQFTTWCRTRSLNLFAIRRADIESFARDLEALGRSRATVTRRLYTIAGFYKYAVEEELLEHSPAAHVRRPRLDYEPHARTARGQLTLSRSARQSPPVTCRDTVGTPPAHRVLAR